MSTSIPVGQDLSKVFHDLAGGLNILGCFISLVIKDPTKIKTQTALAVKTRLDETIEVFRSLQLGLRKNKLNFQSLNKTFTNGVLVDLTKQVQKLANNKDDLIETNIFDYIESKKALVINKIQLKSIFNTLYDNAYDAQKNNVSKHCDIILSSYNKFVCIKFKDYGCGISDKQINKIFDEDFTTKSHGSGYGLYYIKGLILSLGGEISVISKLGFGTSFSIKIPLVDP
ncbi:MAG: hypothetical protein COB02_12895 [Candidatus Cloacimonadota bacterium]|nr:MAG: hypothetical protein COB02_12895 [Candidatus Cloacimonadota bacterium]